MSNLDDLIDAVASLEELRQDVIDRIDAAIELLNRAANGAPAQDPDPAQAVADGLDGEVTETKETPLSWYPAPEHIAQVRERYPGVITDQVLRDLTARYIRWHENKGETLPYPGASQRWFNWVRREAQTMFEASLASKGLDGIVRSDTHHRATATDVDNTADDARAIAEAQHDTPQEEA